MKTGDRVKVVNTDYKSPELANGQEGEVLEVIVNDDGKEVLCVAMDNGFTPLTANPIAAMVHAVQGVRMDGWAFFPEEVEVIKE
jgi:hypothetical protein